MSDVVQILLAIVGVGYFVIGLILTMNRFIDVSPKSEVDTVLTLLKAVAFWATWPVVVVISARRKRQPLPKASARFVP